MAATLTVTRLIGEIGEYAVEQITVLMDSSYATGGEVIDATGDVGYLGVWFTGPSTNGYVGKWIASTQAVKALYGDNNNAADGPLIEVPSTTDLSAETFDGFGLRLK